MKFSKKLKIIFFTVACLMYFSGSIQWLLKNFFQVNNGMGDEPHPAYIWVLRLHGTTSVAMLLVLGYLLRDHILPSFKIGKHLKSGLFLACYFLLIVLTVPPLMYLTNQSLKTLAENIHTYVGLTLIAPFIIHILLKNLRQFTPANQE